MRIINRSYIKAVVSVTVNKALCWYLQIVKYSVCTNYNDYKCNHYIISYLLWWKSCASGEGRNGRWYPQWEIVVLITASIIQSHSDARWLPKKLPSNSGPEIMGSVLTKKCSTGWQYVEHSPIGAVHSWWVLWMRL